MSIQSRVQDGSKKWKDVLLKSGLPLENDVSHLLNRMGFVVSGHYSYMRRNERGREIECSVDVSAFDSWKTGRKIHHTSLELLVECKYSGTPSTKWLFVQYPEHESNTLHLTKVQEDLCVGRLSGGDALFDLEMTNPLCQVGKELYDSGKGPSVLEHGLSQLCYAMPYQQCRTIADQAIETDSSELGPHFTCPILVTNAPLFVLKHDANLSLCQKADNLRDIADQVDRLVVSHDFGNDLAQHVDRVWKTTIRDCLGIEVRMHQSAKVRRRDTLGFAIDWDHLENSVRSSPDQVLVISLPALESWICELRAAVRRAAATFVPFARLQRHEDRLGARMVALPAASGKRGRKG